ncbi:unnamed protein product [Orchesella dallaii]|uniref:Uncharacterized protein n=1 Tax=Orchesella dallaii TaxID=48710 RepID=A0ABP1R623_9HEXA
MEQPPPELQNAVQNPLAPPTPVFLQSTPQATNEPSHSVGHSDYHGGQSLSYAPPASYHHQPTSLPSALVTSTRQRLQPILWDQILAFRQVDMGLYLARIRGSAFASLVSSPSVTAPLNIAAPAPVDRSQVTHKSLEIAATAVPALIPLSPKSELRESRKALYAAPLVRAEASDALKLPIDSLYDKNRYLRKSIPSFRGCDMNPVQILQGEDLLNKEYASLYRQHLTTYLTKPTRLGKNGANIALSFWSYCIIRDTVMFRTLEIGGTGGWMKAAIERLDEERKGTREEPKIPESYTQLVTHGYYKLQAKKRMLGTPEPEDMQSEDVVSSPGCTPEPTPGTSAAAKLLSQQILKP